MTAARIARDIGVAWRKLDNLNAEHPSWPLHWTRAGAVDQGLDDIGLRRTEVEVGGQAEVGADARGAIRGKAPRTSRPRSAR